MAKRNTSVPPEKKAKSTAPNRAVPCAHVFIGNAGGVECSACGLKLTAEEYRSFLKDN